MMKILQGKCSYIIIFSFLLISACGEGDKNREQRVRSQEQFAESIQSSSLSLNDLMGASLNEELDIVQKAADQGVNLDQADAEGRTPLMLASFNDHTTVVDFLLDAGADFKKENNEGRTPLIFAASGPNPETVELLLEKGADPDNTDNVERWTPLMFAAAEGNTNVVQVLLDHGADPDLEDDDGETALDFARSNGHAEIIQLLE